MISLHICKHNSAFKRNKRHETRNRKYGFGVFGVYSKSLSFQLVNYCRPQLEGDFPFMGVARLLAATKKDRLSSRSFLYRLNAVKKRARFSASSFYTLKKVEKKGPAKAEPFLYPQAVSNRCCGNENPESWATRR